MVDALPFAEVEQAHRKPLGSDGLFGFKLEPLPDRLQVLFLVNRELNQLNVLLVEIFDPCTELGNLILVDDHLLLLPLQLLTSLNLCRDGVVRSLEILEKFLSPPFVAALDPGRMVLHDCRLSKAGLDLLAVLSLSDAVVSLLDQLLLTVQFFLFGAHAGIARRVV